MSGNVHLWLVSDHALKDWLPACLPSEFYSLDPPSAPNQAPHSTRVSRCTAGTVELRRCLERATRFSRICCRDIALYWPCWSSRCLYEPLPANPVTSNSTAL